MGCLLVLLQQSSTVPVRNGAAVIKTLLDLRDYQVRGDGPGTACQRGDGQSGRGSFGNPQVIADSAVPWHSIFDQVF